MTTRRAIVVGLPLTRPGLRAVPRRGRAEDIERGSRGILLLAHGAHARVSIEHTGGDTARHHGHAGWSARSPWNDNVERLARRLGEKHPTEIAFGMADPASILAAVDRLERRGVTEVAAIPLFVSSHSPIIGNFRYILGLQEHLAKTTSLKHLDRATTREARIVFGGGMDAHPLISEIPLDRALEICSTPAKAQVILIAHGPNTDEENRLWLRDLEAHAAYLRERGGFHRVSALTHRNDAPSEIKAAAKAAFRQTVENAVRDGDEAVVVPVLLSSGGVEREVEADLAGLPYRFGKPLMPHPNIERWAVVRFEELVDGARPSPDRRKTAAPPDVEFPSASTPPNASPLGSAADAPTGRSKPGHSGLSFETACDCRRPMIAPIFAGFTTDVTPVERPFGARDRRRAQWPSGPTAAATRTSYLLDVRKHAETILRSVCSCN